MFKLLDGPQTLGRGMDFLVLLPCRARSRADLSGLCDSYDVGNFSYFLIWIFMALGLCLMWGYGGMLSFGQTLFFGIAGYAYGVLAINMGGGVGDDRRTRPVDRHCDDRGRDPRLLHDLGRHQRHLLRHRDPVGDAGAGVLPWTDGRAGMAHRPRAAERLQRHEGHGPARRRRLLHRGIGALLRHGGADRDRLPCAAHAGEFPHSAT